MVACLETNATGNFLRRNRHGYLGSSCHAVRFLIVSRDHIVRERFCLCEGHMQEMWAWVRLQLILLPLLWAKAGLKRAGRVFRKRFRASLSFRPFPTRGSRYETRRVVLIGL